MATEQDLLEEIRTAVIAGDLTSVADLTSKALESGVTAPAIMDDGLIPAMSVVGDRFEKKEYFVPEVLVSARTMDASLSILRPLLEESKVEPLGRVAIGTVKGDLHDIGKNVVAMVLTGAGLAVENLGTDVPVNVFVEAARAGTQILGMSSLLTTTRPVMAEVVKALEGEGLRDAVKVVIGGAAVTARFSEEIGADAYGTDATDAVRVVKSLLGVE